MCEPAYVLHCSKHALLLDIFALQFFINEDHVRSKSRRDCAVLPMLQALNEYVTVEVLQTTEAMAASSSSATSSGTRKPESAHSLDDVTLEVVKRFDVVVCCGNIGRSAMQRLNELCRRSIRPLAQTESDPQARMQYTAFIACSTRGSFGRVFCDFGPKHLVFDATGKPPSELVIRGIQTGEETVLVVDTKASGLVHKGQKISFREVPGIGMLKTGTWEIVRTDECLVVIAADTTSAGEFAGGACTAKVEVPQHWEEYHSYGNVADELSAVNCIRFDLASTVDTSVEHAAHIALDECVECNCSAGRSEIVNCKPTWQGCHA